MADIGSATFSQTDANNNTGTMPSWSGSAAPSTLDDAGRAFQGAVTREWNWRSVTVTSSGADTKTLTYSVAPAAYYNGQRFAFINGTVNTTTVTLNVNSVGAKTIKKMVNGTATNLAAGDMAAGAYVEVAYNTSGDYFVWLNRDYSVTVPDNGSFLRNRIINGAMQIDQRNAGAATNVDGSWTVDRWNTNMQGGGVLSGQRSTTAPAGHINSLAFTVTTADASITGADLYCTQHKIEGLNISDLGWGAAGAQSITISFWVRASVTGTYACSIANGAFNRGYTATFTISAANTWEQKTITIAGDTSGTWLTDTGIGIRVYFDLGSGPTYNAAAANTWSGSPGLRTSGTVSLVSTLSATFYVTGVQLEVGAVATPFERRPYGQELELCQRYYQTGPISVISYNTAGANTGGVYSYKVQMRSAPTAATGADNYLFTSSNITGTTSTFLGDLNGCIAYRVCTATGACQFSEAATFSAEL